MKVTRTGEKKLVPLSGLFVSGLDNGDRGHNAGEVRHVNPFDPGLGEQLHPDLSVSSVFSPLSSAAVSFLF